jgi:hypothetical protein
MRFNPAFIGRMLTRNSFLYSLLVVSSLSAKILHLFSHIQSLPILLFLLYLPTFLIEDICVIVVGRLLLHQSHHGLISTITAIIGGFFAYVSIVLANEYLTN